MIDKGKIILDIEVIELEKFINELYKNEIEVTKIKKINIIKVRITISYIYLRDLINIISEFDGKYQILETSGVYYFLEKLKKRAGLVIGSVIFFVILYGLSSYIWIIDISSQDAVSPFEIRKQLSSMGIKPGIKKDKIIDKEIEAKLETSDNRVLWTKIRIEGITLRVNVLEKVNPPSFREDNMQDCIAKMDGKVKKIFVKSGTAAVMVGDIVKEGQVLIKAENGCEGLEYKTPAEGIVVADTFVEKNMTVSLYDTKITKTGRNDRDIFIELFGMKIYLKKYKNNFENYDKIEENNTIISSVKYNEIVLEGVKLTKEEAIELSKNKLGEALSKELIDDEVIKDYSVYTEILENDKINVKVTYNIEQDIVQK